MRIRLANTSYLIKRIFIFLSFFAPIHVFSQGGFTVADNDGCAPFIATFTYTEGANPTNLSWNFGNSTLLNGDPAFNSGLLNPTISYLNSGSYTVTLIVTNDDGTNTYTSTNFITVFEDPSSNLESNINEGCGAFPVIFTDLSTEGDGAITQWNWDFGDGGYSDSQNPTHTYDDVGIYDVSLSVTDNNGCNSVFTIEEYIEAIDGVNPNFSLSTNFSCTSPTTLTINNNSSGDGVIDYYWDFGNSTSSTLENPPAITYNSVGNYIIELTMTSDLGCTQSYSQSFQIQNFYANFYADLTCTDIANFINQSDPAFNSFSWDFGDPLSASNQSSLESPGHLFSSPGAYTVTLTAYIDGGCETVSTMEIQIVEAEDISYSIEENFVCLLPAEIPITINNNIQSLTWELQNSNLNIVDSGDENDLNMNLNYGDIEGGYDLNMDVVFANGCSRQFSEEDVLIFDTLNLSAFIFPRLLCEGSETQAWDSTEFYYDITSYFWDFGTGDYSTSSSTTYTYENAGDYTASLNVSTDEGCEGEKTFNIQVGIPSNPSFTYEGATLCIDDSVQFTFTGDPSIVDSYSWSVGGITQSSEQSPYLAFYDVDSVHTTILTTTNNGCEDTSIVQTYVNALGPKAIILPSPSFVCKEETPYETSLINATISGENSTYLWEFEDSYHPDSYLENPGIYEFFEPGAHLITLTATDSITGCSHEKRTNFLIDNFHIYFTNPVDEACNQLEYVDAAQFQDVFDLGQSDMSVYWDFGDGTDGYTNSLTTPEITHQYNDPGSYLLQISTTDYHGCPDTISKWINVHPSPISSFSVDDPNICPPDTLTITNFSFESDTTIVDYEYSLFASDTNYYYTETPSIFIENFEDYFLTQTIEDGFGCVASSSMVISPPVFNLDYSVEENMCYNTLYPIENNSTAENPPLTFLWEFGTGISTDLISPSIYVDELEDSYFVNYLSVTDSTGCTLTDSFYISMSAPELNFNFSIDEASCPPIYVDFGIYSNDSISLFEIDYGDGDFNSVDNAEEAADISHVYNLPGYYDLTFSVTDTNGCPGTVLVESLVQIPGPWATFSFDPDFGCPPLEVTFEVLQHSDVDEYFWVFGDGNTSSLQNPVHTYNLAGTYTPVLIVEDTINLAIGDSVACLISYYEEDIVLEGPIVDFFILEDTLCYGSTNNLQIQNLTQNQAGFEIESYLWDYGDGETSSNQNPGTYTYDEPGIYTVSLTVTTTSGCVYTMTQEEGAYVMAPPSIQPYVQYTPACPPMLVNFYADSTLQNNPDINYLWNFGDGESSTDINTSHSYSNDASYTAILTTSTFGCDFTYTLGDDIASYPVPEAAFNANPIFENNIANEIQFENESIDEDHIEWYLNNNFYSSDNEISINAQMDDISLYLVAYNTLECSDTAWFSLNDFAWETPNIISPNTDGRNDYFVLNFGAFGPCIELSIYNRWGLLIYENANYKDNWNGKNQNGKKVSDGTYYYIVNICNKTKLAGYITVIR